MQVHIRSTVDYNLSITAKALHMGQSQIGRSISDSLVALFLDIKAAFSNIVPTAITSVLTSLSLDFRLIYRRSIGTQIHQYRIFTRWSLLASSMGLTERHGGRGGYSTTEQFRS